MALMLSQPAAVLQYQRGCENLKAGWAGLGWFLTLFPGHSQQLFLGPGLVLFNWP